MQAVNLKGSTWAGSVAGFNCAANDDGISSTSNGGLLRAILRKPQKYQKPQKPQKPQKVQTAKGSANGNVPRKTFGGFLNLDFLERQSNQQDAKPVSAADEKKPLTVKSALNSAKTVVENTPMETFATVAVFGGAAAFSVMMSGAVLSSIAGMPLIPEALEIIGVSASGWLAVRYASTKTGAELPSSPIRALSQLLDRRPGRVNLDLSDVPNLDDGTRQKLKMLAEQRDSAFAELEELKGAASKMARVVAEKEALEAVALQLAEERDEAMGEVRALKGAVDGMTERMRAIEAMLAQEVGELRQQNQALETVALQLASERDGALTKVAELQKLVEDRSRAGAEKDAAQLVAARLAEERDTALSELKELREVVANLRADSESGLTPQAEVFIKSRVRDLRSKYVSVDKSFAEQPEAAEKLVAHLVNEFGAPREWTASYLEQFLESSAGRSKKVQGAVSIDKGVPAFSGEKREAAKSS